MHVHARDGARGAGQPLTDASCRSPAPAAGQVLVGCSPAASAGPTCTSVDGELTEPKLPLVLGHQIVGEVVGAGAGATRFAAGDRVGVPWLGWTDGDLPLLPLGPREPLRAREVHRLRPRRRLRRARRGRRALLLPAPRRAIRTSSRRRCSAPG